ncbi:hypothetical protein COU74_00670 [Candidatus Peregrinibacteria bacterium CG10_big_fil_rev_8_21_14_0_10_36_19]|nr:MAG: hypothetical protein COU74_00670 [Candidatus Peregrinibacteria bacterium CG10_big_fil_rev_8_21_14_0_10_36_19]
MQNSPISYIDFVNDISQHGGEISLVEIENDVTNLDDLSKSLNCKIDDLYKTVCLNYKIEGVRNLIAVIVPAVAKVDLNKVENCLENIVGVRVKLKAAQPDFILSETGFIPGGIPPVGFQCKRFVDTSIFEKNIVYAGGGNNLRAYTAFSPTVLEQVYPDILKGDFIVS